MLLWKNVATEASHFGQAHTLASLQQRRRHPAAPTSIAWEEDAQRYSPSWSTEFALFFKE